MKENSVTFWYAKEEPEHTRKILELFADLLKIKENPKVRN